MTTHRTALTDSNSLTPRSKDVLPLKEVLQDGASELKGTLGHIAQDSKGAIDQMVRDGKSRVGQLVDDGKTRVNRLVDDGRSRFDTLRSDLSTTIRERPIQSLLIVAGVGAFVGMMLRRRNR